MNELFPWGAGGTTDVAKRQFELPDYTSPPTNMAVTATPEDFRSDDRIDFARNASAQGLCNADDPDYYCHIPFPGSSPEDSKVGVIWFPGGLVDPRSYSPLASLVSQRYGIPVVIPIFANDIAMAFGGCDTGRLDMARAQFGSVEQWIYAGHSLGGVGATIDVWTALQEQPQQNNSDVVGGLVLMGADIQQGDCGEIDFSDTDFPMAIVTGSEDGILNRTRFEENLPLASNATLFLDIFGATHGDFGSYDASGRIEALGPTQQDGIGMIPPHVAWEMIAAAIYNVASRTGVDLPPMSGSMEWSGSTMVPTSGCPPTDSDSAKSDAFRRMGPNTCACLWVYAVVLLVSWMGRKIG
jgi:hypothetical protein